MDTELPLVVLVDDVHENIHILHHCLKDEGYNFGIAQNGEELFRLVALRRPTLILLDVMLPDMDGFTVAERLAKDGQYADIPIIFITARTSREDRLVGFSRGAVDYISKPFDPEEVRARVKAHVALQRALQEQRRLNDELRAALDRVKTLEGIIPICSKCKKVRTDEGYWTQVERYITEHTGAMFSHSLCPDCAVELFPQDIVDATPQKV